MKLTYIISSLKIALSATAIGLMVSCNPVAFNGQNPTVDSLGVPTPPIQNPTSPVSCTVGSNGPQATQLYPTTCLQNPGLPQNAVGIEMNNLTNAHVTLSANNSTTGTQNGVYLYIEIATYVEPDTIVINANSTNGQTTELLYVCNYGTYTLADPSNPHGKARPYSDTIMQFSVWLPIGTASITFSVDENTAYNSGSPTYIGVWNLNEFSQSIPSIPTSGLGTDGSYNFRPQSAPLTRYNDQLDKTNPSYPTYCAGDP